MPAAARRCRLSASSACRSRSSAAASGFRISSRSTRIAWSRACSAWATCSRSSRRPKKRFRSRMPRSSNRRSGANEFTLEDFRDQLRTIKKMGPLEQILGMLPGMGQIKELAANREAVDDKQLGRVEAIINSMTPRERRNHQVINGSRRKRIARGSGTSVEEVNRLLEAVRADEEDAQAARRDGRTRQEARRPRDDEVVDEPVGVRRRSCQLTAVSS